MKQREITFYGEGIKMVGNIYPPDGYKESGKRPGIIASSDWTGVSKIYPAISARQMTARGFACMGFDYRSFRSSGSINGMDKHTTLEMETDDINNTVTFFKHQPEVDVDHITLIGQDVGDAVCTAAAYRDKTVRTVTALNPFMDGRRWMRMGMGSDRFNKMLHTLGGDKYKRITIGGPVLRHPYESYPDIDESGDFYVEKTLKSLNGGVKGDIEVECGKSFPTSMSSVIVENFVRFNAWGILPKLAPDCAVFVGHGKYNESYNKEKAEDVYRLANEPKQLHYMDGKCNEWTFDEDPKLGSLYDTMAEFFGTHI